VILPCASFFCAVASDLTDSPIEVPALRANNRRPERSLPLPEPKSPQEHLEKTDTSLCSRKSGRFRGPETRRSVSRSIAEQMFWREYEEGRAPTPAWPLSRSNDDPDAQTAPRSVAADPECKRAAASRTSPDSAPNYSTHPAE
jgi:hypothetical protein